MHIIDTLFVPAPLQLTALEVVAATGWRRALKMLGIALADRRRVATDAVTAAFGQRALALRPRGGYHLWVALPTPWVLVLVATLLDPWGRGDG